MLGEDSEAYVEYLMDDLYGKYKNWQGPMLVLIDRGVNAMMCKNYIVEDWTHQLFPSVDELRTVMEEWVDKKKAIKEAECKEVAA